MKWSSVLVVLPLLGACDGDKLPEQPGPPARPEVEAAGNHQPPAALPARARDEDDAPPDLKIEVEPVTAGDPDALPSERVVRAPAPPDPVTPVPTKKRVAVERVELPAPALDLSLPDDWAEALEPAPDTTSIRILPPLFESAEGSRSMQMSGSLLPGVEQSETLIDGAQINIELRR